MLQPVKCYSDAKNASIKELLEIIKNGFEIDIMQSFEFDSGWQQS
ncbi:MAG TPA: hypothetical protein VFJ05_04595 [Nitrososphaeraceae archaeon]|nr:hypothetical protein [Nitrososphaeraceae archaeon]